MASEAHFLQLRDKTAWRNVHYRRCGSGAPLIVLHPSPLSASFMQPIIELLSAHATVIAPDTAGYGFSDPLADAGENLDAYVDWLAALLQGLGLKSAALYGSATGAQIAIEFAKAYPQATDYLILDNAASFLPEQRDEILQHYFPDLSPQDDGSHLLKVWNIVRDMYTFFPWFERQTEARLATPPPPLHVLHDTAIAYLQAGPDYATAYRAAFLNEDAQRVLPITRPVRVIRWQGSLLKNYTRRFDELDWPEHIKMVPCGPTPEERSAAILESVKALAVAGSTPPAIPGNAGAVDNIMRHYIGIDDSQYHVIDKGGEAHRPLVCVHDAGGAADDFLDLMQHDDKQRRILAIDLPGHGLSATLCQQPYTIDNLAAFLNRVLEQLDISRCDILGEGLGAAIGAELAKQAPDKIDGLELRNTEPPQWSPQLIPDLTPKWDGSHLLAAWYMLRDSYLYYPWFNRSSPRANQDTNIPKPATLTRKLLQLMRSAAVYENAVAEKCRYGQTQPS